MTAKLYTMTPEVKQDHKCSFCSKKESTVKKMFGSGTGKFICNECITQAKAIFDKDDKHVPA